MMTVVMMTVGRRRFRRRRRACCRCPRCRDGVQTLDVFDEYDLFSVKTYLVLGGVFATIFGT